MRVSVIMPATDRPATLDRALAAISAASDGPDEVIVVEDHAQPGPGAARNAGAARASGELLVFVDSDVEVHPDTFSRIRRAFAFDPGLTALFGSYDDDPASPGVVSSFRNLLHHHAHQRAGGPATTFWAGLGAVRRDAFFACGGFDASRYRVASIEDIDLGLRLAERGAQIVLDGQLQGKHLKHWSTTAMLLTDVLRRGAPWSELLLRERRIPMAPSVSRHAQASAAASVWLAWAVGRRRPAAVALAAILSLSLDAELYELLLRQRGMRVALAGPLLNTAYNLVVLGSLPLGVAHFVIRDQPTRPPVPVCDPGAGKWAGGWREMVPTFS